MTRGATPALAAATRVVQLVATIDREDFRAGPGDPHEAGPTVHLDPVIRVGQPGPDPFGGHAPTRPVGPLRRPARWSVAPREGIAAATLIDRSSGAQQRARRAVIIGGGVGGTSIAYHLAERGWTDIVLLDRAELTSGSTFHSAGLVGQLRSSVTLTRMMMYGTDLYRRLAAETGAIRRGTRSARCGWHRAPNGSRSSAARPAGRRRSASRSSSSAPTRHRTASR